MALITQSNKAMKDITSQSNKFSPKVICTRIAHKFKKPVEVNQNEEPIERMEKGSDRMKTALSSLLSFTSGKKRKRERRALSLATHGDWLPTLLAQTARQTVSTMPSRRLTQNDALVVLGYALNADGTVHDILVERLEAAAAIARKNPSGLVVVSGGMPRQGSTEARAMGDRLIGAGVNPQRIILEPNATTTQENAYYCCDILIERNVERVFLLSSEFHIRRAFVLFSVAAYLKGAEMTFEPLSASRDLTTHSDRSANDYSYTGLIAQDMLSNTCACKRLVK